MKKLWHLTIGLGFPEGLLIQIERKFPMFESNNKLFRDNYFSIGYVTNVKVALLATGVMIKIAPIMIFDLTITYRFVYEWFGMKFNSVTDSFAGDVISDRLSDGNYETGKGQLLTIMPMFKVKLGPVLITNTFILHYLNLNRDRAYFHWFYGHLQTDGFNFVNNTGLGFFLSKKVILSFGHSITPPRGAGYTACGISVTLMVNGFNGISKSDNLMFAIRYMYKSRNKMTNPIFNVDGLVIDFSYKLNFDW